MNKEIKEFTVEQTNKIEEVSELHYNNMTQGMAILKMYKEYLKGSDDKSQELFSIEMERVVEVAIEKLDSTHQLLCETSCKADYLINPY